MIEVQQAKHKEYVFSLNLRQEGIVVTNGEIYLLKYITTEGIKIKRLITWNQLLMVKNLNFLRTQVMADLKSLYYLNKNIKVFILKLSIYVIYLIYLYIFEFQTCIIEMIIKDKFFQLFLKFLFSFLLIKLVIQKSSFKCVFSILYLDQIFFYIFKNHNAILTIINNFFFFIFKYIFSFEFKKIVI